VVATMMAPNRYDSSARRSAVARMALVFRSVSETWKGHPDGEREVGEVDVGRRLIFVEVDPAALAGVVQPCIAGGVHGVHAGPCENDGLP